MKILIVDDLPLNRKVLHSVLEAENNEVVEANDGLEALAELQKQKVDAIISDILMPRMDGYRLCHEVRTSERFKLLPFIIYTASYTSPADEKLSLDLGADKFLRKPAPAKVIVDMLHELTTGERYRLPRRVQVARETEVMKEYSERLVAKLEQKNQELQRRTEELRTSEGRLRLQATALDTAANAIIITDRAGKILWANPAFTTMTGYTSAEAIGQTPRLIKSGKHDGAFYRHLWQTILSGQTWRGELTNLRKNGSLYHGEQTITPVRSEDGTITNFIGIMNDVTERKRAEEELRATHTQLCQLLEHSPAVIYTLKLTGQQVAPAVVSDNVERLLGVTVTESTNYDWWLRNLHPEDRERAVATLGKAVESNGYSMEYRIRHKDGTYRWVEDNNRVVRNTAGQPVEMVGVWTDITDRKQAQEVIAQQTRLALLGANVSVALTRSGPLEELLQHCTELLVRHLDAAFVRIWILSNEGDVLELKASAGIYTHLDGPHARVPVGKYKIGLIAQERKPHLTNSVLDDPRVSDKEWARREGMVAFAGHPLLVEDRLLGVVALFAQHPLSAATLAALASVADAIALGIHRKKLETEVMLREQRFSSFFAGATAGLALVDEDLRFVQINDTLAEMHGVPAREHPGRTIQEILPKLAPKVIPLFQRVLATGAPLLNVEVSGETPRQPGVTRYWVGSFFPVAGKRVAVEGVGAIVVELTERKQAEAALRKSQEQFREMMENVEMIALTLDLNGNVTFANDFFLQLTGWKREEVVGQDYFPKFIPSADQTVIKGVFEMLRAGTIPRHYDNPIQTRNGELREIHWNNTILRDPTGEIIGVSALGEDVTERKKTERRALRSQRLEAIGTLAGGVAHDLNNALAPIMMGVEMLKAQYPDESQILDLFLTSATRGADMVRQLLTFAKGAEGERVAVQPVNLLKEMRKIMQGSFPKNIQLVVKFDSKIPTVRGDPTQLHQILLNLCVNARDAMPKGGTLTLDAQSRDVDAACAKTIPDAKPGRYVVLRVRDTGTGIPPEIIDRIFEPFFTTKGPDKGTGLGLSTVLGIARGHGGFLNVYSQSGQGSTFAVYLPAEHTVSDVELDRKPDVEFRGQGETILVVDDEAAVREMARHVLRRLNFKPLTATDGTDALVQLGEHRVELRAIITDIHMPHMDGLGFVRALRRMLPDIPVVVASGRMEEPLAAEFKSLGVTTRLDKPFTEMQLAETLKILLTSK